MEQAVRRPEDISHYTQAQLEDYFTRQLQTVPGYKIPGNYEVGPDGRVHQKQRSVFINHPWLIPLAGVGAGLGAGALAGTFAGGGAGAAGAAGAGEGAADAAGLAEAGANGGAAAAGAGAAGTGAATAGAASGALPTILKLAASAPAIVGALRAGRTPQVGANDILTQNPDLQRLIQLQRQQAEESAPVKSALAKLAARLMPQGGR